MTNQAAPTAGSPPAGPSGDPAPTAPARLTLRRPREGRWIAGVATGLAAHMGLPVWLVRLLFVLTTFLNGAGLLAYVFWWVTVPPGRPEAVSGSDPARSRLAPRLARADASGDTAPASLTDRLRLSGPVTRLNTRDITIGVVLLSGAALLLAVQAGWDLWASWLLPALIVLGGIALAWSQLDGTTRGRWLGDSPRTRAGMLRLVGGILLTMVGVLMLVGQEAAISTMVRATVASVAVVAGVILVLAPWWLKLVRELGDERAARAREAERADIAAHLHDSVLQTLALIRARADDSESVSRMARAQERELREWLYDDRPSPGESLAAELRDLVGQVEDAFAPLTVDTVAVGDCVPGASTAALLQATREALVNAATHGRPPVSVYLEVGEDSVETFVRDRGDGFDIDEIAPDRFGVRESILGRIRRRDGVAEVQSRPGWGTEVRMRVPREEAPSGRSRSGGTGAGDPGRGAPGPAASSPTTVKTEENP
ncbi:ATP-binding protein [Myceligenerans indicum]|uniref:PspC domain-containing protein n=1 Tax=Myceligenerans indicum TaxID=2593663 RepID=A0ABS1LGG7_9MICO|nr:ATP-binding protein [Myceligenerans indicum]MBL0884702.1 PspC domain-containing protein [Myceligenerans indicum]